MPLDESRTLCSCIRPKLPPWPSKTPNSPIFLSLKGAIERCASSIYILQPMKIDIMVTAHVRDRVRKFIKLPVVSVFCFLGLRSEWAHLLCCGGSASELAIVIKLKLYSKAWIQLYYVTRLQAKYLWRICCQICGCGVGYHENNWYLINKQLILFIGLWWNINDSRFLYYR